MVCSRTFRSVLLSLSLLALSARAEDRVARARPAAEPRIRARFAQAHVAYPPGALFLRVLKREGLLELWAGPRGAPLTLVHAYPVCAWSGELGPKRTQGDAQVPEGVYVLDRFNPVSNFHLSLRVSYPNASDQRRGTAGRLGGDIYVHGNCVSIGCVSVRDGPIEEIYLAALDAKKAGARELPIHLFPQRLDAEGWESLKARNKDTPALLAFWEELMPIYRAFESTRRVPKVTIDAQGRYALGR